MKPRITDNEVHQFWAFLLQLLSVMHGTESLTDETILRAVGGSRSDLEQIVTKLEPQVRLMVAARLCPTPAQFHAVDDLTQKILLALTIAIDRLEHQSVRGIMAFISGITRRKVAEYLRQHRRGSQAVGIRSLDSTVSSFSQAGPLWQFLTGTGTTPRTAVANAEQVSRLMSELGTIKSEYRDIITMAFFDQLPMYEIARQMNISRPAASMLLMRAVKKLRRNMQVQSQTE